MLGSSGTELSLVLFSFFALALMFNCAFSASKRFTGAALLFVRFFQIFGDFREPFFLSIFSTVLVQNEITMYVYAVDEHDTMQDYADDKHDTTHGYADELLTTRRKLLVHPAD